MVTRIRQFITLLFLKTNGFTFLMLFLVSAPPVYNQNTEMVLNGKIMDLLQNPIEGALVEIMNTQYATYSRSDGSFSIGLNLLEKYQLRISQMGYKTFTTDTLLLSGNHQLDIVIQPISHQLDGIEIKSGRGHALRGKNASNIEYIGQEYLLAQSPGNLIHSLQNLPGISSMDVGSSISKPVIRGLGYYRVVFAENGLKQEGQQWSAHHGAMGNPFEQDEVQVIKGPASIRFGSDAIGGVINILPGKIPAPQSVSGQIASFAKSNNQSAGANIALNARNKDFYIKIHGTIHQFADFLVPADSFEYKPDHWAPLEEKMVNTAGKELFTGATIGLSRDRHHSYFEANFMENQTGFFGRASGAELINYERIRLVHEKSNRDILPPYQTSKHIAVSHFTQLETSGGKWEIRTGWQLDNTHEYDSISDFKNTRPEDFAKYRESNLDLAFRLTTLQGTAMYSHILAAGIELNYGISTQYQKNISDGFNHLLPSYQKWSNGIFVDGKYPVSDNSTIHAGIRTDYITLQLDASSNPYQDSDPATADEWFNLRLNKNYTSYCFSTGMVFIPNSFILGKINLGKSFRIPSVYELAANGLHRHELRYEEGNPDLKPEKAYTLDGLLEGRFTKYNFSVSPFITYFDNYLYLAPTPRYKPGAFSPQVYEYHENKALLSGSEFSSEIRLHTKWSIYSNLEYVYAVNLDQKSALPFTPPPMAFTGVNWQLPQGQIFKKSTLTLELRVAGSQNYVIPNELNTPGYHIWNLKANSVLALFRTHVTIALTITNLANRSYLNHLSYYRRLQIPEAGRDFQLQLIVPFETYF